MSTIRSAAIWPYLKLMRPANLVTAVADVMTGLAIGWVLYSGQDIWRGLTVIWPDLLLLCVSTVGLYGGGVVFNDIFDLEIDRVERPERPLPSGEVQLMQAVALGSGLFLTGTGAAFCIGPIPGLLAIAIALLALVYDKIGKHAPLWGPFNMSLCRAGNLLLGISVFAEILSVTYGLMILPVLYISSITLISRGEVGGGNSDHLTLAVVGYLLVIGILLNLGLFFSYNPINTLPLLALFIYLVFPPLLSARRSLIPGDIRKAVKAGVISLIVLDAALAAGFAGLLYGILVVLLLPLSFQLGRYFSVT